MRYLLALVLVLSMVGAAAAYDLGNAPPEKTNVYPDYVNPDVRQGGDTIDDATVIGGIPYDNVGTTAGYFDDYDEVCPYDNSTSPDVVYTYTPAGDIAVDIDLCGSSYDTKLYVYDDGLNLVACNDDFYFDDECGVYVSRLANVGDYVLAVGEGAGPCDLQCPPEGFPEGEPPLQDDQDNAFNDGCSSGNPDGFQDLSGDETGSLILCATSGWFLFYGANYPDTDWFVLTFGPDGIIELTADAEWPLYVHELGPQDCDEVGVVQQITVYPCVPASMTITGEPFATVWLYTRPPTFAPPGGVTTPYEYDYIVWLSGLEPGPVAVESRSWTGVKSLYR
jgi:hypothetical protein